MSKTSDVFAGRYAEIHRSSRLPIFAARGGKFFNAAHGSCSVLQVHRKISDYGTRYMVIADVIFYSARPDTVARKPEVIFVLGGPGSGKGTTCSDIVKKCGYVHLSAGDLLREERAKPISEYGELIESHIRNGTIVPVAITCSLLERAMNSSDNPHKRFLIDGFPRNQDNVDGWNKMMADKVVLKGVIYLECSEKICTERCLRRGKMGSGRTDDNEESLKKRHVTYINDTMPIIEYYEKLGLVYKFDSSKPPNEVFEAVHEKLKEIGW